MHGPLKGGCIEGYRRIKYLDGAFLKSVCKDELLSCNFRDENN